MIFPAIKLHLVHGFSIAMLVITRWCIWCMILVGFNPQDDPSQLIRRWFRQNMSKPCHPTNHWDFWMFFPPKYKNLRNFIGNLTNPMDFFSDWNHGWWEFVRLDTLQVSEQLSSCVCVFFLTGLLGSNIDISTTHRQIQWDQKEDRDIEQALQGDTAAINDCFWTAATKEPKEHSIFWAWTRVTAGTVTCFAANFKKP